MSCVIIYSSKTGNTKKIAECMAKEISCELINLDEVSINDINLEKVQIILLGSGVYANKMHENVIKFVENLNRRVDTIVFFVTWFGRGKSHETAINRCKKVLESNNQNVIDDYFECYGGGFKVIRRGHPNEKDFENARKWVRKISGS